MLVAVVADTHLPRGARRLPEACLDRLRRADLVLHAGDFVSAAFLAELESLGPPVAGVYGNMDEPEVSVGAAIWLAATRSGVVLVETSPVVRLVIDELRMVTWAPVPWDRTPMVVHGELANIETLL